MHIRSGSVSLYLGTYSHCQLAFISKIQLNTSRGLSKNTYQEYRSTYVGHYSTIDEVFSFEIQQKSMYSNLFLFDRTFLYRLIFLSLVYFLLESHIDKLLKAQIKTIALPVTTMLNDLPTITSNNYPTIPKIALHRAKRVTISQNKKKALI